MAQIAIFAVQAISAVNEGMQRQKAKIAEAEGLHDAANRGMAATTREMAAEETYKEQMESKAIAAAAASGAGVDDPTVVKIIGDLNAEGEYRIMSRLWVGQTEAEGLRVRELYARRDGRDAMTTAALKTVKTAISSFGGNFGGSEAPSSFNPTASAPLGTSDAVRYNPGVMYG